MTTNLDTFIAQVDRLATVANKLRVAAAAKRRDEAWKDADADRAYRDAMRLSEEP